jgi:hypothetical protein
MSCWLRLTQRRRQSSWASCGVPGGVWRRRLRLVPWAAGSSVGCRTSGRVTAGAPKAFSGNGDRPRPRSHQAVPEQPSQRRLDVCRTIRDLSRSRGRQAQAQAQAHWHCRAQMACRTGRRRVGHSSGALLRTSWIFVGVVVMSRDCALYRCLDAVSS